MDVGFVVRRQPEVHHGCHPSQFAPFGDSSMGMAVELHEIDHARFHQSPSSPARDLALSRSQWNSGVQLELFERIHIVVPVERLFQPGNI